MVVNRDFLGLVGNVVFERGLLSYSCQRVVGVFAFVVVSDSNTRGCWFEVWKLRDPLGSKFVNRWGVRFPSDNEFGYYGWSFSGELAARSFFDGICKSRGDVVGCC